MKMLCPNSIHTAYGLGWLGCNRSVTLHKDEGIREWPVSPLRLVEDKLKGYSAGSKDFPSTDERTLGEGVMLLATILILKWSSQHNCRSPKLFLMEGFEEVRELKEENQELKIIGEVPESSKRAEEEFSLKISLIAITGSASTKTMRLYG